MNGKGDTPRNCHTEQYRENYDAIFRARKQDKKGTKETRKKAGKREG